MRTITVNNKWSAYLVLIAGLLYALGSFLDGSYVHMIAGGVVGVLAFFILLRHASKHPSVKHVQGRWVIYLAVPLVLAAVLVIYGILAITLR